MSNPWLPERPASVSPIPGRSGILAIRDGRPIRWAADRGELPPHPGPNDIEALRDYLIGDRFGRLWGECTACRRPDRWLVAELGPTCIDCSHAHTLSIDQQVEDWRRRLAYEPMVACARCAGWIPTRYATPNGLCRRCDLALCEVCGRELDEGAAGRLAHERCEQTVAAARRAVGL